MSQPKPVVPRLVLDTERLHLEPIHPDAAGEMAAILSDPSIYRYMPGSPPPKVTHLSARYARQARRWDAFPESWLNWIIRRKDTQEAIGQMQATIRWQLKEAEVAWVLGPAAQRKGYAYEAMRVVLDTLQEHFPHLEFTCTIDSRNEPSKALARKLNFSLTQLVPRTNQVWRMKVVGTVRETVEEGSAQNSQ